MSRTQVRRITPQDPEYWQDDPGHRPSREITYRSSAYVPALPEQRSAIAKPIQPIDINVPGPKIVSDTTATDRAQAFVIETKWLAILAGVVAVVMARLGEGHPLFAIGTLLVFFIWYSLVWLVAWVIHRIFTPEALAWYHAHKTWKYIDRQ